MNDFCISKSPSMLDEKYYKKGVCFLIFWNLYIFNCIWEKCIQNFCKKNTRKITVVLNGIICFSVRFCDSLLFMLKIRFEVFSFANRKVQGFSSDRKILMSLLSVLFYLQNVSQFFEISIFSWDIWETFIMSLKSTSFPKELW